MHPETFYLLEENTGKTLQGTGMGKGFLEKSPKAKAVNAKINKWDDTQLRNFYTAKDTIKKAKKQ